MGTRRIETFGRAVEEGPSTIAEGTQKSFPNEGRDSIPDLPPTGDGRAAFDHALRAALNDGRIAAARSLVSDAEAVLGVHEASGRSGTSGGAVSVLSRPDLALAKARIALATGDTVAAHAILVQAIETHPDAPALRALMTEAMLATGRATDIRPVLHHLGRKPTLPDAPLDEASQAQAGDIKR